MRTIDPNGSSIEDARPLTLMEEGELDSPSDLPDLASTGGDLRAAA